MAEDDIISALNAIAADSADSEGQGSQEGSILAGAMEDAGSELGRDACTSFLTLEVTPALYSSLQQTRTTLTAVLCQAMVNQSSTQLDQMKGTIDQLSTLGEEPPATGPPTISEGERKSLRQSSLSQ